MTARRTDIDVDYLVREYRAGKSLKQLADEFGICRRVLHHRLQESGVIIRGRSEAERLKWSAMSPATRQSQVRAAHEAAKGRTASDAELLARAQTRERNQAHISHLERQMASLLIERGIAIVHQLAVGPYNCDLAAHPVAVEIFGGHWHWTGDHLAIIPRRLRYFMDRGWHVLMVQLTKRAPLTDATADYVAAYIEAARREPTRIREYRVIRRAGELIAAGCTDDDEISIIPAFTYSRDAISGRYITVPK